tara:strand:- start:271 stop:789 length:519 start_codon:yes stop_codon:yes gene_type:complete
MKTDKRIMAIFGDNKFPSRTSKLADIEYKRSLNNIVQFLQETNPDRVYIIPDNETTIIAALCCHKLRIKSILISPFPGFFKALNKRCKSLLMVATENTDNFILLSEGVGDEDAALASIKESVEFAVNTSNAVAYLRNKKTDKGFEDFIEKTATDDEKMYFDLSYNSREVFAK